MLTLIDTKVKYEYTHCQQCGVCQVVCPVNAISLQYRNNGLSNVIVNPDVCIRCCKCVKSCPANKISHVENYISLLAEKKYYLGHNVNLEIRSKSSSGGVAKTLIIDTLKDGCVEAVYSLKKTYMYPYAEGEFYTVQNLPSFDEIPNSVYHSVMLCKNLDKVKRCKKLMVVGTACQLQAMQNDLNGKCDELIKVCIFCKQQKTLDSTRFLAKVMGSPISSDMNFSIQYRGEGWPGIVRINEVGLFWNKAAQLPFGRRLWTVPGCNICGDPFGLECGADITLMDPWGIKQPNNWGETLITVHTQVGMELIKRTSNLILEHKEYKEVETALGLVDIWRKRKLVPYFRGEKCDKIIKKAGRMEQMQSKWLQIIVTRLPRMPFVFYRLLCHLPDLRNRILRY